MDGYHQVMDEYYGIMKGGDVLVFLKTGSGGNIYGVKNRYLMIAKELNEGYHCTVVVAANPKNSDNSVSEEIRFLRDKLLPRTTYYVGYSKGAFQGAMEGERLEMVEKMLLINGPLVLDFNNMCKNLASYEGKLRLIYGKEDPSIPHLSKLLKNNPGTDVRVVEKADHTFYGMTDELLKQIEEFLFLENENKRGETTNNGCGK